MKSLAALALVVLLAFCSNLTMAQSTDTLARMRASSSEIRWQPRVEYARIVLTVSAPDGRVITREFVGTTPSFKIADENGSVMPDGHYVYEMAFTPNLAQDVKDALAVSRESGDSDEVERQFKKRNLLPSRSLLQSGSFLVERGSIVVSLTEEEPRIPGPVPGELQRARKQG